MDTLGPARIESLPARIIDCLWWLWLALLPLGHLTGVHNTLALVTIAATLTVTRARGLARCPGLIWIVALVALASLSLTWSADAASTASKLRSDLLIPVAGYLAAFIWAKAGRARPIFYGFATGLLLLALCSLIDLAPESLAAHLGFLYASNAAGQVRLILYPGVGDASSDAVLIIAPLLVWRAIDGHWRDATTSLLALASVFVILRSENRNAVLVFPLALLVFSVLWTNGADFRQRRHAIQRFFGLWWVLGSIGMLLVLAAAIEHASQQRILASLNESVPFGQATFYLIAHDPRPQMWAEFIRLGSNHPWLGTGFGRTVAASAYDVSHDQVMLEAQAQGFEHAHNMFLNLWLQLGYLGLAIGLTLYMSICQGVWVQRRRSRTALLATVGIMTLVVTTIVRNLTDDFLVYGIASSFWVGLGVLAGLAFIDAPVAPTPSSTQALDLDASAT